MRKELITHLERTEDGVQASRVNRQERLPMTDKRMEIVLRGITKIVVIIMSFLLAGTVIVTADALKLGIIAAFTLFAILLCDGFEKL